MSLSPEEQSDALDDIGKTYGITWPKISADFFNDVEDPLDNAVRKLDDLSTEIDDKLGESTGDEDENDEEVVESGESATQETW